MVAWYHPAHQPYPSIIGHVQQTSVVPVKYAGNEGSKLLGFQQSWTARAWWGQGVSIQLERILESHPIFHRNLLTWKFWKWINMVHSFPKYLKQTKYWSNLDTIQEGKITPGALRHKIQNILVLPRVSCASPQWLHPQLLRVERYWWKEPGQRNNCQFTWCLSQKLKQKKYAGHFWEALFFCRGAN